MENKKTLIIWIAVDLLLLIGVIFVCVYWFNITSNLKDPCSSCSEERPEISPCLEKPLYQNEINFSEIIIIKKNNIEEIKT